MASYINSKHLQPINWLGHHSWSQSQLLQKLPFIC